MLVAFSVSTEPVGGVEVFIGCASWVGNCGGIAGLGEDATKCTKAKAKEKARLTISSMGIA